MQPSLARTAAAAAGVVVAILTVVVCLHPAPLPGEVGYLHALQDAGEPVPSIARLVRTATGTPGVIVGMVVLSIAVLARFGVRGLGAVAVALLCVLVVQPVLKEIVDRPRPDDSQVEVRATHTSKSFPSGHSMSTTVVWGALAGLARRRHRTVLAAWALVPIVLTFFASGVQGVHWPTDAVAGTLLGALGAWAVLAALPRTPSAPPALQSDHCG